MGSNAGLLCAFRRSEVLGLGSGRKELVQAGQELMGDGPGQRAEGGWERGLRSLQDLLGGLIFALQRILSHYGVLGKEVT